MKKKKVNESPSSQGSISTIVIDITSQRRFLNIEICVIQQSTNVSIVNSSSLDMIFANPHLQEQYLQSRVTGKTRLDSYIENGGRPGFFFLFARPGSIVVQEIHENRLFSCTTDP